MDLVFDAGGTKLRVAVSKDGQHLFRVIVLPVPKTYASFLRVLQSAASELLQGAKLRRVAGGVPGTLDGKHERILLCTQLPNWAKKPIKKDLERILKTHVRIENDSALAALGEATHGIARKSHIVAYIGFGTGVGGCRIVDGHIDARSVGFEPGRQYIFLGPINRMHPSPHPGDWESYVSGMALRLRFGKEAKHLDKQKIWRIVASEIGLGLVNVTMFWSPDLIILGGSLMKRLPLGVIRTEFHKRLKAFPHPPRVLRSNLGDYNGLSGALALLKEPSLSRLHAR